MTLAMIAFFILLLSAAFSITSLFFKIKSKELFTILQFSTVLVLIMEFVIRSAAKGFPALTNIYESLIIYSALVSLILGIYTIQKKLTYHPAAVFIGTMISIGLLAVSLSPIAPKEIIMPAPVLRSGWLVLHVAFSFIGEAFFAFSFALGIIALSSKNREKQLSAEKSSFIAIIAGYPFFTLGALIFGAIWAQNAWDRWWGWDPKETWALITWIIYTLYLHFRLIRKKRDKLVIWISIIGFALTVFTFLGVRLIKSGLHGY